MDKKKNYLTIKNLCENLGADLFGVADIRKIKKDFLLNLNATDKLDSAISIGVRLSKGILAEISSAPTRLYFHHYRTLNFFLDQLALRLANYIQDKSYYALPIPASQILDWQKQKGHLSHKKIGYLAGLGWIGRNNLLVNKKFGSQFRLVSILTDMPLEADKPVKEDCKECRHCIVVCPAQAIEKDPAKFDHIKCFDKLKEFQKQRLVDQYICGVCVSVCAGNRK